MAPEHQIKLKQLWEWVKPKKVSDIVLMYTCIRLLSTAQGVASQEYARWGAVPEKIDTILTNTRFLKADLAIASTNAYLYKDSLIKERLKNKLP